MKHDYEDIYLAWKNSPPEAKAAREKALHSVLCRYAAGIVYEILHRPAAGLVADIVSKALLKEAHFRGESKFTTWFYRLAHNSTLNYLRRQRNLREVPLEAWHDGGTGSHDAQARLLLRDILKLLSPTQKLLLLEKLRGATTAELCQIFHVPSATLKARWRALKKRLSVLPEAASYL